MILEFEGIRPTVGAGVFIAPGAVVIGRVTVGDRVSIWFGSVVRGDVEQITIGRETNIQDLSVIHADADTPTSIGSRVTVGHRAILHGCTVEDNCVVGMGAIVQNRSRIGRNAIVAAGSVVLEGFEVPAGTLAAGVPAKVKRELTGEEIEYIGRLAEIYLKRSEIYRAGQLDRG